MRLITLFLLLSFTGYSQLPTRLKLKQLEQGSAGQLIVADSLGNASWGTGGDSPYTGSGTMPLSTLMTVTEDPTGDVMDFAIGDFPSWPDLNFDGTEFGFFYGKQYQNGVGLISRESYINLGQSCCPFAERITLSVNGGSQELAVSEDNGIVINRAVEIHMGFGDPNGVVTAQAGSLYLRTAGIAGATLYVKESGGSNSNTGWVAK